MKIEIIACPECGSEIENRIFDGPDRQEHSVAECKCGYADVDVVAPVLRVVYRSNRRAFVPLSELYD